jgi:GTPase SAR1 family protein
MEDIKELANAKDDKNAAYKVAMLGDSAVGKSSLTYQFTTSEYICAYDLSLGATEITATCDYMVII